jgi:hypothetical protein
LAKIFEVSGISKSHSFRSKSLVKDYVQDLTGNLVEAYLFKRSLALKISDPKPSPRAKKRILETLEELGFIGEIRKGYAFSKEKARAGLPRFDLTKVEPTSKVLELFDPGLVKPSKSWSVVLRAEEKEIPVKQLAEEHKLLYTCALRFQKQVNVPIRSFRRIFSGDLESGGRVYSNYQQMSQEDRGLIRIGNEKTVELDYQCNQIRMLFSLLGAPNTDDVYSGFSEDRGVVKKAMNVLVNTKNPKRVLCDRRWEAPFRWTSERAEDFMSEVFSRYPVLEKVQGSGLGLKLQKLEGDIALEVMKHALYNNTVVLPVHDSFIVKESEAEHFRRVMDETWEKIVVSSKNYGKTDFLTY